MTLSNNLGMLSGDDIELPPADVCTPELPPITEGGAPQARPGDDEPELPYGWEQGEDAGWTAPPDPSRSPGEQTESCVFMGPPGVGKTTLLGAMCHACMQPPRHPRDHDIKLLPGEDYGRLLREAHALMYLEKRFTATQRAEPYQFTIRVTRPARGWHGSQLSEVQFTVRDGPGGALFPRDAKLRGNGSAHMARWEKHLIEEAAKARTLVLCVDANHQNPWRVTAMLPELLGRIAEKSVRQEPEPLETFRQRLSRWARSIREHVPPRRRQEGSWLGADRFLLLLTQADKLVAGATEMSGQFSPAALATAIDPVQQACSLLGESALYQIYTALHPQATFAVGVTSAWGFEARSGKVFRKAGAGADEGATPSTVSEVTLAPNLRDWRPLGLRDAVIYMVSGEAQGTVRQVLPSMLHPHRRLRRVQTSGYHLSALSRQL